MILAIDIGNTNIVLGCFDQEKLIFRERISSNRVATDLEYAAMIKTGAGDVRRCARTSHRRHTLLGGASYNRYFKKGGRKDDRRQSHGHRTRNKDGTEYSDR